MPNTQRTYLVTRHPGALEWLLRRGWQGRWVRHLVPTEVHAGDTVIGTLPLPIVALICQQGATYLHLSLSMPEAWRGRELSAEQLDQCHARLEAFEVRVLER